MNFYYQTLPVVPTADKSADREVSETKVYSRFPAYRQAGERSAGKIGEYPLYCRETKNRFSYPLSFL